MDPLTLTALGVFLAPYLQKAGEKVAEKTVEAFFDSRKDLAENFRGLFQQEIITLGLNDLTTAEEVTQKLGAKPEIRAEIDKKLVDNKDLVKELEEAFKPMGITINAKNIGAVINNPTGPINLNNTFS